MLLPEIYFHSCLLVIISSLRTWRLVITSHARTYATRTNAIHQLMIISHVSSLFPDLSIKNAWMHTRALLCLCFASVWCRSISPIFMSDLSYTGTFSNSPEYFSNERQTVVVLENDTDTTLPQLPQLPTHAGNSPRQRGELFVDVQNHKSGNIFKHIP